MGWLPMGRLTAVRGEEASERRKTRRLATAFGESQVEGLALGRLARLVGVSMRAGRMTLTRMP